MKNLILSLAILASIPTVAFASEPDQSADNREADHLAAKKARAHKRAVKAQERADKARAAVARATKRAEKAARKASEARTAEQEVGK